MNLREFGLLADENIHPDVVAFLKQQGFDVVTVHESQLRGSADREIIRRAVTENRVVITHDSDFGTLAIAMREPVIGIVYIRPGHIEAGFTIQTIRAVLDRALDIAPPFVIVAQRTKRRVRIRLRRL